jgi:hypothetical protein
MRNMRWAGLAVRMEDVERAEILVGKPETKELVEVEIYLSIYLSVYLL